MSFTTIKAWGEASLSDFKFAELPVVPELNYTYVQYSSLNWEEREGGERVGGGYYFDKKYFVERVKEKEVPKKAGGTFTVYQLVCQEIRTIEPFQVGGTVYIDIAVKKDSETTAKSIFNRFSATLKKGWMFLIIPPKPKTELEKMMELYKPLQLVEGIENVKAAEETQDDDDLPF